jgi:hypothetical protein
MQQLLVAPLGGAEELLGGRGGDLLLLLVRRCGAPRTMRIKVVPHAPAGFFAFVFVIYLCSIMCAVCRGLTELQRAAELQPAGDSNSKDNSPSLLVCV